AEWKLLQPREKQDHRGNRTRRTMMTMKTSIRFAVLCAALAVSSAAFAQQYPTKTVRIIVPFPAGGQTDIAGRLIAQKLSERLGHQFYIENIAGAGGNLGMGQAAKAAGDGY